MVSTTGLEHRVQLVVHPIRQGYLRVCVWAEEWEETKKETAKAAADTERAYDSAKEDAKEEWQEATE